MRKQKLLTYGQFQLMKHHCEKANAKSETEPGHALSVEQLVMKAQSGIAPSVAKQIQYMLDEDSEDFDHVDAEKLPGMDMVDRRDEADRIARVVADYREKIESRRKRKEESRKAFNDSLKSSLEYVTKLREKELNTPDGTK